MRASGAASASGEAGDAGGKDAGKARGAQALKGAVATRAINTARIGTEGVQTIIG